VPNIAHLRRVNRVFRPRPRLAPPPKTPFGGPPVLPKPRQPPRLPPMSKFMNKAGLPFAGRFAKRWCAVEEAAAQDTYW